MQRKLRIYISVDIEGVAGVVAAQQGQPGNADYERARMLMTEEVNAAIAGLVEAGVEEILVNDSHGPMVNILPDVLHPAAELILGRPKPMNMACGLNGDFNAVFLVGHHSMANKGGVLAHTTNGFAFREVRVNGTPYGEPGLYGAYAGELGVPVALVSGDDCTERENCSFFPKAEFVVVKQAIGRNAARQVSIQKARDLLKAGAKRAVERLGEMAPFRLGAPYLVEFEMNNAGLADQMEVLPPATRVNAVTIGFECKTIREIISWMTALSAMSAALR